MPPASIEAGHPHDVSPFALCHLLAREMRLRKSGPRGLRLLRAVAISPSSQTDPAAMFDPQPVPLGTVLLPSQLPNSNSVTPPIIASPAVGRFQDLQSMALFGAQALRSHPTSRGNA